MSESELKALLGSIKISESPVEYIKVAYDHFRQKTQPPFILFRNTDTTTYKADNKVYWIDNNYIVDLVTELKNPQLEQKLEQVLNNNELPFDKEEDFIDSEQIYQIRYYI